MATEDDVRRIALSLPETIEKPWYGSPGFRVKDKGFLRIRNEAEGGLVVFVADDQPPPNLPPKEGARSLLRGRFDVRDRSPGPGPESMAVA